MSFTIGVRTCEPEIFIVDIAGNIDSYTSNSVKAALLDLVDNGHLRLLVNLERVRSIDSTGLGVLIAALQRVRPGGGRLDLVCTNPLICKLFDITGLAKTFTIFRDERTAVAHQT